MSEQKRVFKRRHTKGFRPNKSVQVSSTQFLRRHLKKYAGASYKTLGFIMPDKVRVKLPYRDTYLFTATSGSTAYNVWRGNSLFDPDSTGSGHQPHGFDQLSNFYDTYRVMGSSFRVQVSPVTTTSALTYTQQIVLVPTTQSSISTAWNTVTEYPYAKSKITNIYQAMNGNNIIYSKMSTAKIYGLTKRAVKDEDNLSANVGANPVDQWFWTFETNSIDQSTTSSCYVDVRIVYDAIFEQRAKLPDS